MPSLSSNRVRVVLLFVLAVAVWQIFVNWPTNSASFRTHKGLVRHRVAGTPVVVTVFYEALCPDSKNFVINQLQTAFYKAPTLLEIQLVPYGKAETRINKDGSLNFTCQHGKTECEANMYHACVIETTDEPKVLLDVVACMIRNNMDPKGAMHRCTHEHQMDTEQVQKCFDSPHGAELLKMHGELTHALTPSVAFIPTVTLDGSQGRQASILKDLLGEVCKIAGGAELHPDQCSK